MESRCCIDLKFESNSRIHCNSPAHTIFRLVPMRLIKNPKLHEQCESRPLLDGFALDVKVSYDTRWIFHRVSVVLATGPGNPPAVRVWTGKTVRFGSRTVQKPDPEHIGGPNPDPYPSTHGFCRVWLDPSVRISGSSFRVFLFMVAFRYPTVLCKILPLVHHCLCSIDWLPL